MNGIADTGFLVAFARQADQHHGWAVAIARQISEPGAGRAEYTYSETALARVAKRAQPMRYAILKMV